tara:strand:+ start:341 stop:679 length:339 start_codon:yes stop_codon:yes gene_type:complete
LPAISGGAWEPGAAIAFCLGYLLIRVGFLTYYLEIAYKVSKSSNGFFGGLGWNFIINGDSKTVPPPTIIAASRVLLFNSVGIVFGAVILIVSTVNLLIPNFAVDAFLAKNAI